MTVRVISDRPIVSKRAVCPNCGYELEFTGEDVLTSSGCDGDQFQGIACPRKECQRMAFRATRVPVRWP